MGTKLSKYECYLFNINYSPINLSALSITLWVIWWWVSLQFLRPNLQISWILNLITPSAANSISSDYYQFRSFSPSRLDSAISLDFNFWIVDSIVIRINAVTHLQYSWSSLSRFILLHNLSQWGLAYRRFDSLVISAKLSRGSMSYLPKLFTCAAWNKQGNSIRFGIEGIYICASSYRTPGTNRGSVETSDNNNLSHIGQFLSILSEFNIKSQIRLDSYILQCLSRLWSLRKRVGSCLHHCHLSSWLIA